MISHRCRGSPGDPASVRIHWSADAIQPAFDAVQRVVDEVFPVEVLDAEHAKLIVLSTERLSARGGVHLAVMERHGVVKIASFDRGFDGYPGIQRIGP